MIIELTETEFVSKFGETAYHLILESAILEVKKTPEYNNGMPYCHSVIAFPFDDYGYKTLIIEINCKKTDIGVGVFNDFGIVKYALSHEDCPDELLDRYNEIVKIKSSNKFKLKY